MKLRDIGFYTLSDERAKSCSPRSPLKRCEIVITERCNFKCPYCRGLRKDIQGTLDYISVANTIDIFAKDSLENIRFSGGEPTTHPFLKDMVSYARRRGVKRIAISTNGSADLGYYVDLLESGVNDFSISLDACCSAYGKMMCGGIDGMWEKVISNIKHLARKTYVTVGIVFTKDTYKTALETIQFADSLGVSDIRIIPAAQYNKALKFTKRIDPITVDKYPILKYRVKNFEQGRHVRGLQHTDCRKCYMAVDDIAVAGGYHFPCIIYMREHGQPIGRVSNDMRSERVKWLAHHNTWTDPICRRNCLDVCVQYNNAVKDTNDTRNAWYKF